MSNNENTGPRPAAPVLPSRAAGEAPQAQQPAFSQQPPGAPPPQPYAPPPPPSQVVAPQHPPMFQDPPTRAPASVPRRRPAKKKPVERLSAREIARLNKIRNAKLAKARKAKPAKKAAPNAKTRALRKARTRKAPPSPQVVAAAHEMAAQLQADTAPKRPPGRPRKDPTARKNPNRPLELKNQMLQIVQLASELTPAELAAFAKLVPMIQDLDRGQRKRVIAALQVVYA